jgi:acyl-CoA reductase-like NAD-dependent aldehyde dehydrogenase
MRTNTPNDSLRRRLVEQSIERYVDWRQACAAVHHTYERWSRSPAEDRALTFAAYRAALDQEESAATLYGALLDPSHS